MAYVYGHISVDMLDLTISFILMDMLCLISDVAMGGENLCACFMHVLVYICACIIFVHVLIHGYILSLFRICYMLDFL